MANISGNNSGNIILGTPEDDNIFGRGGGDILLGGEGNDDLFGGNSPAGSAPLIGRLVGGLVGLGVGSLAGPAGGTAGGVIGGVIGEAIGRQIGAGNNADLLFGDGGDDDLFGEAGNDLLRGGDDNDRLDGGSGNDALFGDAGSDRLDGGGGNDQLFGDTGNDRLDGGDGNDRSSGGGGGDDFVFVFVPPRFSPQFRGPPILLTSNNDTVLDFSRAELERDGIFVDAPNPAAALARVDNALPAGVITDADRNVAARDLDRTGGPDSLLMDFGPGNTLTVVGVTSLTVGPDILFV